MNEKRCIKCGEVKPVSEFHKNKMGKFGVKSSCKVCCKQWSKKYYEENRESILEYGKKYREENREHYRELGRKHYKENREFRLEYSKRWREENRDLYNSYSREYIRKNKSYRKYLKKYREENREHYRELGRKYREENREAFRARVAERRAKRAQATPPWLCRDLKKEIEEIYATCPEGYHVDHIVPIKGETVCGLHVPWNLQHLPAEENIAKGNRHWPDMWELEHA